MSQSKAAGLRAASENEAVSRARSGKSERARTLVRASDFPERIQISEVCWSVTKANLGEKIFLTLLYYKVKNFGTRYLVLDDVIN